MIAPLVVRPVNEHDTTLLPAALAQLTDSAARTGLNLENSSLTLDSGFDSAENKECIRAAQLHPVIYPNRRNTKEPMAIARMFRWFDRARYRRRFAVERTFAWQDTYRKLATAYDRLPETRLGSRHLAYTLVNFRRTFVSGSYSR